MKRIFLYLSPPETLAYIVLFLVFRTNPQEWLLITKFFWPPPFNAIFTTLNHPVTANFGAPEKKLTVLIHGTLVKQFGFICLFSVLHPVGCLRSENKWKGRK